MTDRLSHIASRVVIGGSNIWADSSRIAGFAALLLGVFLVLGVGFAGSEIIHNAAHDGRHSMAFPCHSPPLPTDRAEHGPCSSGYS